MHACMHAHTHTSIYIYTHTAYSLMAISQFDMFYASCSLLEQKALLLAANVYKSVGELVEVAT